MTLPVSSYEDLLADVRKIRIETLRLHRQVRFDLFNQESPDENHNFSYGEQYYEKEKVLADVLIQSCDRRTDVGQNCLDHKNLGFHPRIQQGIDTDRHPGCMNIRSAGDSQPSTLCKRCSDEDLHPSFLRKRRSDEDYQPNLLIKRPSNESFPPGFLINRLSEDEFKPAFLSNCSSDHDYQSEWTGGCKVRQIIRQDEPEVWPKRFQRVLCEDSDPRQHPRAAGGRDVGVGVGVGVGVEASASCIVQQQQRRPQRASGATPLASVAAHESKSSTDAAATVRPVNGTESGEEGAATPTSLATRCARASRTPGRDLHETKRCIDSEANNKEDAMEPEVKEEDERRSATPSPELYGRRSKHYNEDGSSEDEHRPDSTSQSRRIPSSYRGTWPIRRDLWANQQMCFSNQQGSSAAVHNDMASVMSFSSNASGAFGCSAEMQGHRRLGAKVDVVYNLLGMLGSTEGREDMSATLLSMSNSIDSCLVMRQSGCLPLLVHLIHAPGQDPETRERASRALHNVVHAKNDERAGRREARVLRILEQLRDYCQALRTSLETGQVPEDLERHPGPTIAALMKLSFDEAHRHAMCQLGGLHAVAELIEMDHMAHGSECEDQNRITLRRYAGMALTNLTFGDGNNKALLCSFREFMKALVNQLRSPSDDLRQVTASVLRNLSWRADSSSKLTLRQVGAVTGLMKAAMEGRKESTLKSILSALWNLSAHCSENKVDICAVEGALAFLVDMLSYKAPSKTLAIIENAGGILRNVSSHVAVREDYRAIVRERGCLQVLLQQLKSPSLTVVSNACGALWNLSAKCPQDQRLLWELGAVPMLRSLVHSKHKMISMGSSAALKNLLTARPGCNNLVHLDSTARGLGLPTLPTLVARRQKALEQEIDQNLAETCDNIEPSTSPTNKDDKFAFKVDHSFLGLGSRGLRSYQLHSQPSTSSGIANGKCNGVPRSESRESMRSVTSTHSDTMFERVNRHAVNGMSPTDVQMKQQSSSLHSAVGFDAISGDSHAKATTSEKKYTLRYKNAIPDRLKPTDVAFSDIAELTFTNSTISWSSAPDQESACSQMLLHSSVEDNLSITSQSLLSASKGDVQSSIAEEAEATASTKEYQSAEPKPLPYKEKPSPVTETVNFTNIYADKSLIRQRDSLNAIQKTISPTISHADGDLFGNYAETDLDQPTDYSLRYAEGTLEEDGDKPHSGYFPTGEQSLIHEDTIKTYCTEGTPRGTSLNSSRAASATDLQEDTRKNLIKDLAIKACGAGQLKHVAVLGDDKLNEPRIESTVRAANQHIDDKLPNLHNYEATVKAMFQQIPSTDYDDTSIRSPSSVRTTPTQITSNSSEYSQTTVISNRASVKSDASNEFMTPNSIYGTLLEKDLTSNEIGTYTGNSASKTSNDSGYQVSDGDEDDEDLLAACINIGMQNNRHRHSFIGNSFEKLPRQECNLTRYQTSVALDQVESIKAEDDPVSSFNITQSNSTKSASNINSTEPFNEPPKAISKSQYDTEAVSRDMDSKYGWQDKTILQNLNKEMPSKPESKDTKSLFVPVKHRIDLSNSPSLSSSEQITVKAPEEDSAQVNLATLNNSNMDDTQVKDILEAKDSESSESIDSVERSEHALLELCIKPGIPKTIDSHDSQSIKLKQLLGKASAKVEDSFDEKSDDAKEESFDEAQSDDASIGPAFEVTRSDEVDTVPKNEREEVYRRQRDPDAMIASLDRLTAALVQQTEAMREREATTTMKQSTISDTWNEESPNEVSFPSISISAPLIASFKSDVPEDQGTTISELAEIENADNETMGMTDSKIIQREAIRLAEAVVAEASKHHELNATSITSIDLDAIKPPSSMGSLISLTASYAGSADNTETFINRDRCHSTSLPVVQMKTQSPGGGRKKSLPIGVVARRALGQGQNHTGSLENLLNECTNSHLENVKPPSMMDDLPDVGDMENSMLSVASITSEIADSKEHDSHSLTGSDPVFDLLKPVANVLSITCMRYAESLQTSANNSLSECLENINPPSLFNEVSEMEESTMEATTDTLCSDTLCIETELHTDEASRTLVGEKIDEMGDNDTDEGGTPLSSEYCVSSSAESTPKRRPNKNHLTPKQKRNLAKERYKTYTIAAEIVKKEEEQRRKMENADTPDVNRIPRGKISPLTKLTPKQRRQEDRARFQTQVLENPFPEIIAMAKRAVPEQIVEQQERPEKPEITSPVKTSIPTLTKLPVCKALRKKRIESGESERYRTRTLNDAVGILKDEDCKPSSQTKQRDTHDICPEEMQTLLEQNATIVINTLNESSKAHDSLGDDLLLECETLSLVSNDSESERSLRMRFVNGLSQKLIGVSPLPTGSAGVSPSREEAEERREEYEGKIAARHEDARSHEQGSSQSDDESSNCLDEQPQETKRPRIIKPGMASRDLSADSNTTDKSEPGSPKAIRGRRKALYSNPITRKSTPQSSPLKQPHPVSGIPIGRSNTSPIVRATRATTLRQNNNSPNIASKDSPKLNGSPKMTPSTTDERNVRVSAASKRVSVPQKGSTLTFTKTPKRHSTPPTCSTNYQAEPKPEQAVIKPLERQGTFTKDEPEVENAPTVPSSDSPVKTKIAKPIKSTSPKVHPTAGKSKISVRTYQTHQTKIGKANSAEKIPISKGLPLLVSTAKRLPTCKATGIGKLSSTSQNVAQTEAGKTFRKVGPLGQRSNSNSNIVSNAAVAMQSRKLVKEATSKIASLRKKVEESKTKQRLQNVTDTRQWISPGSGATEADAPNGLNKGQSFKLFRSSTFEGIPQENNEAPANTALYKVKAKRPSVMSIQGNGARYRNSCDLSGMNASDAPCKIPVKSSDAKKDAGQLDDHGVTLRRQQTVDGQQNEVDPTKRISRLGSFIRVDPTNPESLAQIHVGSNGVRTPASAIVPPFNYNPKQDIPSQIPKPRSDDTDSKLEVDYHAEIVTASARVTTV